MTIEKEVVKRVLLELRQQHGANGKLLPVEKAAPKVPVTIRTWQRWEAMESVPYLRHLEAVAAAFKIPVTRFLTMDEQDAATTSILSLEEIREEFRVDVDQIKDGLAANRRLLAVLLEKLAPAEFANAMEELADLPANAAEQPSEPARTEDDQDSQETG